MTDEAKKLVAEYMGWFTHPQGFWYDAPVYFAAGVHGNIAFDLNDAAICVQEMQKRGDWQDFVQITSKIHKLGFHSEVIAWLFNAENFFNAMSEWLKERKK
jgi:hypothetical protein